MESGLVANFSDLCAKLEAHFSTNIPTKKSSTELLKITQIEDGSTKAYLKRFNEKML